MGIVNIHILTEPDDSNRLVRQAEELAALRIAEHRRGEHPYGSMRRDCPLCQSGK